MTTQMGSEPRRRGRAINGGPAGESSGETSTTTGTAPATDRLQDAATSLADQAGRTAEMQASNAMTKAGESLEQVARAIRDAAEGLRGERPEIAGFADTAAQRVDEASTYLRDHDAREVIDSVQEYARRQPAVVIAGGLAAGLLIGRFLRSGTPPDASRTWDRSSTTARTETDTASSGVRRTRTRAGH